LVNKRELEVKSKILEREFHFGSKGLLSEALTQVTVWVPHYDDLEFAMRQLEKGGIAWVVKRKKSKNWDREVWRYALWVWASLSSFSSGAMPD